VADMADDRYARQKKVILDCGQDKLKAASVLIIGCGGLGCPVALYLATSGIGSITLIDDDVVSLSNLHRQVLFSENDIGLSKVEVAKRKLETLNSEVTIKTIDYRLDSNNSKEIIDKHDLVIVGCDNFPTRFVISKTCNELDIPYINASVLGDEGTIAFYDNIHGCYQCMNPDLKSLENIPAPSEIGVLGSMVGVIGTATATMAIEIIIGNQTNYLNKIFSFDAITLNMKSFEIEKNNFCKLC